MSWLSRRETLAALAVFALAAGALSALHHAGRPHYRLSQSAAIVAARADPGDRAFLARNPVTSARVVPLDSRLQRVTFFNGPRVVLDAAVDPHGRVVAGEQHIPGVPASGAAIANSPWILALLGGLFLLATMVVPLRRIRNLDALVLVSFTSTVVLVNARLVAPSVVAGSLGLCYLIVRCLTVALAPAQRPPDAGATPLLSALTAAWEPARRIRLLRVLVLASAVGFLMITMTSSGYTDVAAASLAGATDLLHGLLPYGHISIAVHGDTYPILNYLLYTPGAAWLPVSNVFSDLTGSLLIAAVSSLLVAAALYRLAGSQDIAGSLSAAQVAGARLRAVVAWLSFAPVLLAASGGSNDLVLSAALAWMLACSHRRGASLAMLAVASWVKLVPVILLPAWLIARRRGEPLRVLAGAAAVSALCLGVLVGLGGSRALAQMFTSIEFQFQRGSFFAPWYTFGLEWLQPLTQAAVVGLLAATALRMRRDAAVRDGAVRQAAIGAALLLGVQLAANYWTWSYLPWAFPFVAVALLMSGEGTALRPGDAPSPPAHALPEPGRVRVSAARSRGRVTAG